MKRKKYTKFHFIFIIFGIVLIILLLSSSAYLYFVNKQTNNFINNFEEKYEKLNNVNIKMNNLIFEYNNDSLTTFKRLDLIENYLGIYTSYLKNSQDFYDFVNKNKIKIKDNNYDFDNIKSGLLSIDDSINNNILRMKNDLLNLNESILFSYTDKRQETLNELYSRLNNI